MINYALWYWMLGYYEATYSKNEYSWNEIFFFFDK